MTLGGVAAPPQEPGTAQAEPRVSQLDSPPITAYDRTGHRGRVVGAKVRTTLRGGNGAPGAPGARRAEADLRQNKAACRHDGLVAEPTALPGAFAPAKGQPRTPRDAESLARYEQRVRVPIILSAILPLILVPQNGHPVALVVGVASWAVFLVDFVVHRRRLVQYLGTGLGKFDLAVVVLTAPWFLVPGVQAGGAVVLLRLARLVRLMVSSRGARRLFERLGRVALVATSVVVVGAAVAYYAEHPKNPGFATYTDALWWGVVTLTTVGYGDIVPVTATGRWAAVVIMITGVSVLGLLAGSLASFFRLDPSTGTDGTDGTDGADGTDGTDGTDEPDRSEVTAASAEQGLLHEQAGLDAVMTELTALRAQVSALALEVARPRHGDPQ